MARSKNRISGKIRNVLTVVLLAALLAGGLPAITDNSGQVSNRAAAGKETSAELEFTVLDVGQGLAVYMESQGHSLLYDGGDREYSSYTISYLKKQGIKTLDYVVASHYDADHLSGVVGALRAFDVENLLAPDYLTDTEIYQSFVRAAGEEGVPITNPHPGDEFTLGQSALTVLSPQTKEYEDENDYSISLRAVCGESSFLVTGDATQRSESEMLEAGLELDSDVLVLGHHGGAGSTSWDFLQEVNPAYAIVSCEKDSPYGHPAPSVMKRLKKTGVQVYRTDRQGTITATGGGEGVDFKQKPCNDYTPGMVQTEETAEAESSGIFVLNRNSMKFHRPACAYAKKIASKNYESSDKSREELIAQGYSPCKICRP